MYYRVTVRTDGSEIFLRIHNVAGTDFGQWDYVVNVNETRCDGTVTLLKKHVADCAPQSERDPLTLAPANEGQVRQAARHLKSRQLPV